MMQLTLILDNIRSSHNVGAILRTADSAGVEAVICAGITPYPTLKSDDQRDPLVRKRNSRDIAKTALGAEQSVDTKYAPTTLQAAESLRNEGYAIYALEQAEGSHSVLDFKPKGAKVALVLGSETAGVSADVLAACDTVLEIPQRGSKESLNVGVAAGIAVYALI